MDKDYTKWLAAILAQALRGCGFTGGIYNTCIAGNDSIGKPFPVQAYNAPQRRPTTTDFLGNKRA